MSDNLIKERNELLEAVKAPERRRKQPSNWALNAAIIFANVVFCLLDMISGWTVYLMTGWVGYGVLTFLAGFGPLLLHELLFIRPFANPTQKNIAVTGAIAAFLSIVLIGVLAGYVNVAGLGVDVKNAEIATVVTLVIIASFHAVLAVIYTYVDDGVKTSQATAQAVARAIAQAEQLRAGDMILDITQRSVDKRKQIGNKYNMPALIEVLKNMGLGEDLDGNGIPDVLDRAMKDHRTSQSMRQYAADTPRVPEQFRNNGHDDSPNS